MSEASSSGRASASEPAADGRERSERGAAPGNVSWRVERRRGGAGELHEREVETSGRLVELLEVLRPALVLGSRQTEAEVDDVAAKATGVEVVRRRSGGGAVLLLPGRCTWIDVTIGRDDSLWTDDVGHSFHWLGAAWANALRGLGLDASTHVGRPVETAWSKRICFAGLGAGEITIAGRKLVGISQRRTRDAARFQCVVNRAWDPVPILGLLALSDDERTSALLALGDVGAGLDAPDEQVLSALVGSLPG
jgi:lipoate-protein ligase A